MGGPDAEPYLNIGPTEPDAPVRSECQLQPVRAAAVESQRATSERNGTDRTDLLGAARHAPAELLVVGPDCEIGPGSVIGPTVAIARNGTVGSNVTIERAVVDSDCRVGHGSILLDTVLGQDVHLGVDVTVPGGPSDVRVGNRVFEDQQLGAVLADRVRTGGAVSFEPGTLVGPDAEIETGVTTGGRISEGSEVVR